MKPAGEYRFGPIPNSDPPPTAETKREVGRFTLSVPTVIATALITAATTITCTWLSMRKATPEGVEGVQQQVAHCLTKEDFTEAMRQQDARERVWKDSVNTQLSVLTGRTERMMADHK